MNEKYADIEVEHEEIVIHPTAIKRSKSWMGEARIIGDVIIEGKKYSFNYVIKVNLERDED